MNKLGNRYVPYTTQEIIFSYCGACGHSTTGEYPLSPAYIIVTMWLLCGITAAVT